MRALTVCPPDGMWQPAVVRRLQFDSTSSRLVACVAAPQLSEDTLRVCDLGSGEARLLHRANVFLPTTAPAVTPDLRLVASEVLVNDAHTESVEGRVGFTDTTKTDEYLPSLPTYPWASGGLCFAPDGAELIAVRNRFTHAQDYEPEIASFVVEALTRPVKRFRRVPDRFKPGEFVDLPVRHLKWKSVITLPRCGRSTAAALSTCGRLCAVGDDAGGVHVADLKRKKLLASFPWDGSAIPDRAAVRVGFDPESTQVLLLANGRLFSRGIGHGKPWQTKKTLGDVRDFAYHPSGRFLCAVFADGSAKDLDALTGTVRQSFKWSKKPLHSVAFSPDGLTCAAGGENGRVVVWDVDQ